MKKVQKVIDMIKRVRDTQAGEKMSAGCDLISGSELIEEQKTWDDEDESKNETFFSDCVYVVCNDGYFKGCVECVDESDAERLAESI